MTDNNIKFYPNMNAYYAEHYAIYINGRRLYETTKYKTKVLNSGYKMQISNIKKEVHVTI